MNNKQQQLTFSKGITNVPSDALCSDNTLEESVGLVYSDSEHRVIQKPSLHMTGLNGKTLLYIHVYNDQKRYIVQDGTSLSLTWGTNASGTYSNGGNLFTVTGTPNITSIGKILIVSDNNGIHSYLWKTNSYDSITYPFPEMGLDARMASPDTGYNVVNSGSPSGILTVRAGNPQVKAGQQDAYNNLVVGLYSKNLKTIASLKGFTKPFFIRAALELYDGTYTFMTNPILLFPSVTNSSYAFFDDAWDDGEYKGGFNVRTYYSRLFVRQTTDFSEFHDIVKDVVLFATRGVDIYNTTGNQPLYAPENFSDYTFVDVDNISAIEGLQYMQSEYRTITYTPEHRLPMPRVCLEKRDVNDIKNDLASDTVFYKLCSLGLKPINSYINIASLTSDFIVQNLTTQEQLGDDYFSRCNMKTGLVYAYNSRLNLANVSRGVFEGFDFFMPLDASSDNTYDFYVKIKLDTGSVWVKHTAAQTRQKQGIFFFYPDSRAEHVRIFKWYGGCVCDADLTESESLNGAFYLREYPSSTTDEITIPDVEVPSYDNHAFEMLPNYVIQSEVNNPFVFKAAGYFKVGTGKILAMSSVTQALSEGQFGQFPLLVFSESGIWALTVASTGYYSSVHPISREVSNDPPCLVQTDGAVFFTSKKGLMVVVGSQVKCVSEQMSGKTNVFKDGSNLPLVTDLGDFVDYLKSAYIAYDYRDSLLWIFNSGYTTCYTYSIKSGTFSKFTPSTKITNVVNCYPDYLLQDSTKAYSLMGRNDINKDGTTSSDVFTPNRYSACILTRPMKLENALALKSIMQVKHIHDMNTTATLALRIFASNNLKNWTELTSLRGIPWKYYRFRFDFANLIATDRFAGTMLITQERRTDKLR